MTSDTGTEGTDGAEGLFEEACDWFLRLRDDPAPQLLREFDAWRSRSSAHQRAYADVLALWERLDDDVLDQPDASPEVLAFPATQPWRYRRIGMIGAALSIVLAVPLFTWLLPRLQAEYRTGIAEQRLVELEDGSRVHLNADSAIDVDINARRRNIKLLYGEAYFEVAHAPERPFRVTAGGTITEAVGTAFNIRAQGDAVEVDLTEGRVRVAPSGLEVFTLRPGQQLRVDAVNGLEIRSSARPLSWQEGQLIVDRQPLAEVVGLLNRHYHPWLKIVDPALGDIRVSGTLPLDDLDAVVQLLEQSFGIHTQRWGDQVVWLYR